MWLLDHIEKISALGFVFLSTYLIDEYTVDQESDRQASGSKNTLPLG